jgi:hypothetical protein
MQNPPTDSTRLALIRNASAITLAIESLAVLGFGLWMLLDLFVGQAKSLPAALTLIVLYLAAGSWVAYLALGIRKGARWARSGAIFWQTCQLFLASQSFTGRGASPLIGFALIVPSVIVLALMFSKPVLADSKRQLEE